MRCTKLKHLFIPQSFAHVFRKRLFTELSGHEINQPQGFGRAPDPKSVSVLDRHTFLRGVAHTLPELARNLRWL